MYKSPTLPNPEDALPGRDQPVTISGKHFVHGRSMLQPFPDNCDSIIFGMGCFWGAEKMFWNEEGVFSTAVGYAAGITPNPGYEEVCSGLTGHNEVVQIVYQADKISLEKLLTIFWESHDPTQGMRQGNDQGAQYRSGIYYQTNEQKKEAVNSRYKYQNALSEKGCAEISTEILPVDNFYYAEEYHQQYLAKNPTGYCPNHTCSVTGLPGYE